MLTSLGGESKGSINGTSVWQKRKGKFAAEEAAEKLPRHGHSEEAQTTKNLHRADSQDKQVLRCAQKDRTI
jgi:hypothetical protein